MDYWIDLDLVVILFVNQLEKFVKSEKCKLTDSISLTVLHTSVNLVTCKLSLEKRPTINSVYVDIPPYSLCKFFSKAVLSPAIDHFFQNS